jgi:hypothetical protein
MYVCKLVMRMSGWVLCLESIISGRVHATIGNLSGEFPDYHFVFVLGGICACLLP